MSDSTVNDTPQRVRSRRRVHAALVALSLAACLVLLIGCDAAQDEASPRARPQQPLIAASGRILFLVQTVTTYDAYRVNADGSGLVRLTYKPSDEIRVAAQPIVSPDGTRLATIDGGVSLLRIDRPREIERLHGPAGWLAWSHDGRRLASLGLDDQKRLHLNVFDANTTATTEDLSASWPSTAAGYDQYIRDFAWSPDGRRFAFLLSTVVNKGPRGPYGAPQIDLYVAPADGSGLKNLSLGKNAPRPEGGLTWSPDGTRLAFASARGVATVNSDLQWTEIVVPVHPSRTGQRPAWSPDGTRLAWFNAASIVISNPDGPNAHELTSSDGGVQPAWSPDGSRLVFVCEELRALCIVNADGSGLTHVMDLQNGHATFERDSQRISFPVWLPTSSGGPAPGEPVLFTVRQTTPDPPSRD